MLYKMYINGKWYKGNGEEQDVISPVNGEVIGQIPLGTAEDVDLAVKAADASKHLIEKMTVFERAEILNQIADAVDRRQKELAELLTLEHGKPITEALGEVATTAKVFREAGEQIKWMNSEIIPTRDRNKRAFAYRRPKGVYGVISPWNFPLGSATSYYIAPGLAAGNAIVWVPATSSSAVASEFMKCVEETDLPKGVLNLVIGRGAVAGDALVVHELTSAIGFTGSTKTGEIIHSRAGAKSVLLELGGNGPTIVFEDADIEHAATSLVDASFVNAGQICTSTERVLVHESVADDFAEAVMERVKKIKLGDPLDKDTVMGTVHNANTAETVADHVNDAVTKGAKVLTKSSGKEWPTKMYVEPVIVDYITKEMKLNTEETFGPVIPIVRYKDEDELNELIDSSPYRLAAAVFSRDTEKALKFAESLKFGFTNINEASNYWETQIPAGGTAGSASGYGRSGGKASIEEMSEVCTVILSLTGENKDE